MNPSQFDSSHLAICHVISINFPSRWEAGLLYTGAVHGNWDTVELGGEGELGE